MSVLIVYDSVYGNTEAIARAIGEALGGRAEVVRAGAHAAAGLQGLDVLLVGSPTQGGRPTAAVKEFIERVPAHGLYGVGVGAFDTRFSTAGRNPAMRLLLRTTGYAAPRIAKALEAKGGRLVAPPEGFIVADKEGPLRPGELERARAWADALTGVARASGS